jgi:hypothetical protein
MALFAVNQPITTTVSTITVENKFVPGQHHFQLVVVNNVGVESDPMTATVVVSQGILPLGAALKGTAPRRAAKKPAKPSALPLTADQTAKAPPQIAAPTKEKSLKEKSAKTPAKRRTRKKSP